MCNEIRRRNNRKEISKEEENNWFKSVVTLNNEFDKRRDESKMTYKLEKLKVGSKILYNGEEGEVTFISDLNISNNIHIVWSANKITERVSINEIELL